MTEIKKLEVEYLEVGGEVRPGGAIRIIAERLNEVIEKVNLLFAARVANLEQDIYEILRMVSNHNFQLKAEVIKAGIASAIAPGNREDAEEAYKRIVEESGYFCEDEDGRLGVSDEGLEALEAAENHG